MSIGQRKTGEDELNEILSALQMLWLIDRKSEYAGDLHRELAKAGFLGICM